MKWPRMPKFSIDPADAVAILGLAAVSAGAWGRWGWPPAAIVLGSLLLLAYAVRELKTGGKA